MQTLIVLLPVLSAISRAGAKHTKVFYKGRFTTLPRHGSKELKTGTVEGIKRRLGLK